MCHYLESVTATARKIFIIFVVDAVIELLALAVGLSAITYITKPLLLLLLIAVVKTDVTSLDDHPSLRWLVTGQFFSFLGDVALMFSGSLFFGLGMLMFLVTHICYITGFVKLGLRERLPRRKWVLIAYPAFWVIANAALWSGLGPLRIPILVYSVFLVGMAMCSMAMNTLMGIGGTLFMLSDLTIGETVAYGTWTGSDFTIMLTYIIGQALICLTWLALVKRGADFSAWQTEQQKM